MNYGLRNVATPPLSAAEPAHNLFMVSLFLTEGPSI